MPSNKQQKKASLLLSILMLFNVIAPVTMPLAVSAESEETVAVLEESLSVAEAIQFNNDKSVKTVTGYIVGYTIGANNVSRTDFREDWNIAIADDPQETKFDQMVIVQIPSGKYREQFGLKTNPENLGEKVTVTGTLEKYHGGFGLKNPTEMKSDAVEEPEIPVETITIEAARAQTTGQVKTKGIVTAKLKNTIHIQDETAAIAIRPTSLDVQIGDEIVVAGTLLDYNGLLQIDGATVESKQLASEPNPTVISGSELASHQSQLVEIKDLELTKVYDGGDWANYTAQDASGTIFIVRDELNQLALGAGNNYDSITGIASVFGDELQLIPRTNQDIVADETAVQSVYASPMAGLVPNGTEVELTTMTPGATIYYSLDGSIPDENSNKYENKIVIDKDLTIKAIAIKEGLSSSQLMEFTYEVYNQDEGIKIHHIQGEGHESPMAGSRVEKVEGIVTYQYDIRGANYFHMQTPEDQYDGNPNTSEGIVVYTGKAENINVGDLIQVTGDVSEYHIDGYNDKNKTDLSVTQINARDDRGGVIEVLEKNVDLPTPIKITSTTIPDQINGPEGFDVFDPEKYSIDFWESIEGMHVEVEASQAVAPQQHGDLVVITNEYEPEHRTVNGGIRLTEAGPDARTIQFKVQPNGLARNLRVKTGDKFKDSIPGVVNYGFGNYKVYADLDRVEAVFEEGPTEPKATSIVKDDSKLTVAAYNVENFSANTKETPAEKANNIAKAFVDNMNSPDIIGIVEVMANEGTASTSPAADQSYQRLVNEISKVGGPTYEFLNIDPAFNQDGGAPGGNIRVGYLYNPARVSVAEARKGGTNEAVAYTDGKLTLNPGRVQPEAFNRTRKPLAAQFEFQGESVVIVNNHLNSKLGDEPYYGQNQPPTFGSRVQRKELAKVLNSFVKDIKADNPDENVIVLGDMNDFEFSEPLQVLKGDELTNMIEKVPAEERYTYVYQGSSQVLDHILVSNNIAEQTEIDIINVNADFTDMHGRASDHEPVLAQIDLSAGTETPEPSDKRGWVREGKTWYYYDANGYLQTGWTSVNGKWYYMDSTGAMQTGWQEIDGHFYYLNSRGVMQTGWIRLRGNWYYLNANGVMQTGWTSVKGKWYYMNDSGAMQTGWQEIDGHHYYLNFSGEMQTGWILIRGRWYYFNANGVMQSGWTSVKGTWYYLNERGVMQTGWLNLDGHHYYLNISGEMQTGWTLIRGNWYYFNTNGVMQTGWLELDGKWYYLNTKGVMLRGWNKIDGKWYYMGLNGVLR